MLAGLQEFVQRRYHLLLMASIGVGFLVLLVELINYRHFEGAQLIGTGAVVIGAILSFLGIAATGNRRRVLAAVFLVVALAGVAGLVFHNADRLGGEEDRRPPTGQVQGQPPQGEAGEGQQPRGPGRPGQGFGQRIPPPLLSPLSVSGLCAIAAVVLLGRKDSE